MIRIIALTTAYFIAGKLGLSMPFIGSNITLFWPPTGIALAAALIWGPSCWFGIFLGAFLVNLTTGEPTFSTALEIAIGNTLAPAFGALMLKRTIGSQNFFRRGRDIVTFILITAGSMLLSATGGILSLYFNGLLSSDLVLKAWLGWWLGDIIGVMIFSPLLLA
ncbi:MASE1 protein [Nitrosomonas sp. Nm34]|nr:MASE1 protein [Nitrosomonas sp. Nm34]